VSAVPVRGWALGAFIGGAFIGGAFIGGACFVAAGVSQWMNRSAAATNLLLAAALLITVAGLVGIHVRYGDRYGAVGVTGVLATGLGQLVQAASAAGTAVSGDPEAGWATWLFVIGSLLFLPGLLVLTVAVFRSGVPPRWLGLVLIGGVLASGVAQSKGGPALFGLAWIAVGLLLTRRD
jgi:hypothetical protein